MSSLQLSQSVGVQRHPIFKPGVEDRVFIGHRRSEETAMIYVRRAPECRVFSCHNLLGGRSPSYIYARGKRSSLHWSLSKCVLYGV